MRCGLRFWHTVLLFAAAMMLGSCASAEKSAWIELSPDPKAAAPMVHITGMVMRSNLEGGLYLIRGSDGTTYNPTNLPDALRIDGVAVEAMAQHRNDLVSIGMVGSLVELVRIRERSDRTVYVSGSVNYRERMGLSSDAIIEVQLLDVSRQEVSATLVAAISVSTLDRQVPIPFTLAYDPAKIVENHTYALRAVIRSKGALVYTTSTRYAVITQGNPSRADLMLVRVGKTNAPTERLWGTSWVLEDLGGVGVVDRVQATLTFSQDGSVNGNASCNQFRGTATVTDGTFALTPVATTRKACSEAVMLQETRYLEALHGAGRFEIRGAFLYIHVAGRSQPLRFIGAPTSVRSMEAPAAPDAVALSRNFNGIWTVVGQHIPGISAMSDAEAKAWRGRTIRLTASQALSSESHCDQPTYTTSSENRDRYLGSQFNLQPGSLTPLAPQENITVLQVLCGREHWTAMGGRVIRIDNDRVLAYWNGVFFELARDSDFRAVGQEPFWSLELTKGKELRFTYDLGKRVASTPAPVPEKVSANGTSVYHAVTEANDLRVVIAPTRCTDVMSGKLFERTVTVTLNGRKYQGCGERVH